MTVILHTFWNVLRTFPNSEALLKVSEGTLREADQIRTTNQMPAVANTSGFMCAAN